MSTVSDNDAEIEDLITCSVCLSKFDQANRKPKFLACAHTVCRSCLAEIQLSEKIQCPLCRKIHIHSGNVSHLPNNNYAIVLLRKKNQKQQKSTKGSYMDMANETIANVGSLLKFKSELDEIMDRRKSNWSEAIRKRKEIDSHLSLVMTSIKSYEKEIQEKLEENSASLAEMIVESEQVTQQNPSFNSTREQSILELHSLMANIQPLMCPEDTGETIKKKLKLSLEKSERQLSLVSSEYDHLRTWKEAGLALQAYDDSSTPSSLIWDTIIKVDWMTPPRSSDDKNLLLMSQMIFAFAKPSLASAVQDLPSPITNPAKAPINRPNVLQPYRAQSHFDFLREIGDATTAGTLESSLTRTYSGSSSDDEDDRLREAGFNLGRLPIDYSRCCWSRGTTRYLEETTSDEDN